MSVRAARPGEFPAVGALTLTAFGAGPYPPGPERVDLLRDAAGRARDADLRVAVDDADGTLLGTATLAAGGTPLARFAAPDELEVRLLAVHPDARGRGTGAELLADAVAVARAAGAARVVLDTGARNETSQRLYHRFGFQRLPEREGRLGSTGLALAVFGLDVEPRPGLAVRLARPDELGAVGRLALAAYAHDHRLSPDDAAQVADAATRARDAELWVAHERSGGPLLGTMTLPRPGRRLGPLAREDELDLRLLARDPAARGRGVGTALVQHALAVARWRGLRRVVLISGPRMTGAHALCARLGFDRLTDREDRVVEGGVLLAFGLAV